jgi:hypothetical protein
MAKKTKTDQPTELEQHVDAMMAADPVTPPPLDIFAGTDAPSEATSAPTLPGRHHVVKAQPPETPSLTPKQSQPEPVEDSKDDVVVPPLTIDTTQSDEAIDDIVAKEADQVLAAQDAGITLANDEAEQSAPDEPEQTGHPVFWFIVALLAIISVLGMILLTSPGLELPFLS